MKPAPADSKPMFRNLVIRGVNWLGDAVMSQPAIERLREVHPEARISLLTATKLAPLWQHQPELDEVISFERGNNIWSIARKLRARNFDTALIFPNSVRSALEMFLARIPRRIGLARPWRTVLLTHPMAERRSSVPMRKKSRAEIKRLIRGEIRTGGSIGAMAHHLHDYLHLASALGAQVRPTAPRIVVTPAELEQARAKFELPPESDQRPLTLGLNPGAEYGPAKRWPPERFAETVRRLAAKVELQCVIFGGEPDRQLCERMASKIRDLPVAKSVSCFAGKTTLRELCAGLKLCDALLTNDSGPMHLAAAVGTPVIVPFGSTSPELTGPGLPGSTEHRVLRSNAPCAPCFRRICPIDFRCMLHITEEEMARAVLEALQFRAKIAPRTIAVE